MAKMQSKKGHVCVCVCVKRCINSQGKLASKSGMNKKYLGTCNTSSLEVSLNFKIWPYQVSSKLRIKSLNTDGAKWLTTVFYDSAEQCSVWWQMQSLFLNNNF